MALSTLADTLRSQNTQLVNINDGISNIDASFSKWFVAQEQARLEDLERQRENAAASGGGGSAGGATGSGGSGGGGGRAGGMFAGMGAALGLGRLSGGLAKAGIFGLTQMMSETLGNAVAEMTGDNDLGAAAANAAKFGGIGALFGKKFAVLGAVAGAFATPENVEMLGEIGETLGERGKEITDALAGLNIALPSLSDVYKTIADGSNEILQGVNSLLKGDVQGMADNVTGFAAVGGIANAANLKLNKKLAAGKPPTPTNPASAMTKQERIAANNKTASGLSQKKLDALKKQGITVDKGGLKKNGKFMSADKMDEALKSVKAPTSGQAKGLSAAMAKYKNFGKFMKLPIVGQLASVGTIGLVLANDDLSNKEKAAEIAGALGGIGGGTLGALAGATLGTAFLGPLGTAAGGLVGGILGGFSGDYLAQNIAEWMIGGGSEIIDTMKDITGMGSGGASSTASSSSGGLTGAPPAIKMPTATGAQIKDGTTQSQALAGLGGGTTVVAPSSSNVSNSSSTTSLVSGPVMSYDSYDPLSGTRTA